MAQGRYTPNGLCVVTEEAVLKEAAISALEGSSLKEKYLEYQIQRMEREDPILAKHIKDPKNPLQRVIRDEGEEVNSGLVTGAYMMRSLLHVQAEINGERLSRISTKAIEQFIERVRKGMREHGTTFITDEYRRVSLVDPVVVECMIPDTEVTAFTEKDERIGKGLGGMQVGGTLTYFIFEQQAMIDREKQRMKKE